MIHEPESLSFERGINKGSKCWFEDRVLQHNVGTTELLIPEFLKSKASKHMKETRTCLGNFGVVTAKPEYSFTTLRRCSSRTLVLTQCISSQANFHLCFLQLLTWLRQ
jgi:hypothetical protein